MIKLMTFMAFVAFASVSIGQDSYYDLIPMGTYSVGFSDTLLYDSEIQYSQFGYEGSAPSFVKIWFPITNETGENYMSIGDFRNSEVQEDLQEVYRVLNNHMDDSFIRDGIEYDIVTDEPINYGQSNSKEVLTKIKELKTKSTKSIMKSDMDFPVIVYHHGSQGLADENSVMAEYFASRGYIFISTNYHLPYPNTIYGLLPFELEKDKKHNQSTAKMIIDFAKSITQNDYVFYVGHSWGAQEGWCFLNQDSLVNAFVSLETTIEPSNDTLHIKDYWPHVYEALHIKKNNFSIPVLLLAATNEDSPFEFFESVRTPDMIHASIKLPFAHNSYTSFYMMRYFLNKEFPQPDAEVLLSQIELYNDHLELIHYFFETVMKKEAFNQKRFESKFYMN